MKCENEYVTGNGCEIGVVVFILSFCFPYWPAVHRRTRPIFIMQTSFLFVKGEDNQNRTVGRPFLVILINRRGHLDTTENLEEKEIHTHTTVQCLFPE